MNSAKIASATATTLRAAARLPAVIIDEPVPPRQAELVTARTR